MMEIINEKNVLRSLRRGEEEALEWIIQKYAAYVAAIVSGIISAEPSQVEEISSDVFLTLWLNRDRVENGKLKAYISGIARNKAREKLRSQSRELPLEEDAIVISDRDMESEMEEKEQAAFLRRAILAMGVPDKEIFLRHYYYCQSVEIIAREMELSISNVKIRLFRGRKKLKEILCEGGYFVEN